MATNRIDSLDPALIRPGRIDRKIEFPLPDEKTKRRIFNIHTSRMQLEGVNLEEFIEAKDDLSGADIKAMCTEAGLLALRERRMRVTMVGSFFKTLKFITIHRRTCERQRRMSSTARRMAPPRLCTFEELCVYHDFTPQKYYLFSVF